MAFEKEDMEDVFACEKQIAAAHLNLDIEMIDQLLHPDFVIIQPGGAIEDKEKTLASFEGGQRFWEIATCDQLEGKVYGDTAVVIGRWRGKGRNGEVDFDYQARFLSVWLREQGVWRNLTSQSTEIFR